MATNALNNVQTSNSPNLSILFLEPDSGSNQAEQHEPAHISDLLLNQVMALVTKDREEYNLLPFFCQRLESVEAVHFRHEVWRDLEDVNLRQCLTTFARDMHEVRRRITWAAKSSFIQQRRGWHLDAAERYSSAVEQLSTQFRNIALGSRALLSFSAYLRDYAQSPAFSTLTAETRSLKERLSEVRYCINIKGPRIRVLKYDGEPDYSAEIEEIFKRFQQGAVKDYQLRYSDWPDMNHVQSSIADRVARLFPDVFSDLQVFCESHYAFLDQQIATFDRELQFYLAYLDFIDPLKAQGLTFCLPEVQNQTKEVFAYETFDLGLANKLASQRAVVCNDFHLRGSERIIIVSGPNQGGKTTFARMFGQIHYLASLGCPVPGSRARLFFYDQIFTHFGKEEDPTYQSGKLEDDLLRIREVLRAATTNSIIVMNEIFASTTVQDALWLGTRVIERIIDLDLLCVMVTFVDELTLLSPSIVSMASTINPENPVERTFKIVRRPADGLAYAIAIAEKYGVTYDKLRERLGS